MAKLRVQNRSAGQRGIYINGDLNFIASGNSQEWDSATADDVDAVAINRDFRAQEWRDGSWVDLSPVDLPSARQWLAVAKDVSGNGFRFVPLDAGEWYIGTALSSEKPEGSGSYSWEKIGQEDAAPAATPAPADANEIHEGVTERQGVDYRTPVSTLPIGNTFDPAAYLDQNGNTIIAALKDSNHTPEQLDALHASETEGKARKGVLTAIEELQTDPATN